MTETAMINRGWFGNKLLLCWGVTNICLCGKKAVPRNIQPLQPSWFCMILISIEYQPSESSETKGILRGIQAAGWLRTTGQTSQDGLWAYCTHCHSVNLSRNLLFEIWGSLLQEISKESACKVRWIGKWKAGNPRK